MPFVSIAAYFPFSRMKLTFHDVTLEADLAYIEARPDKRFKPVCHECGAVASRVHERRSRPVRDLNFAEARVWIKIEFRRVVCPTCQAIRVEETQIADPYQRVTRRLARAIHDLCKKMTVTDVAKHFDLDWRTVKKIDRAFLERDYGQPDYDGLRVLAVDEIAVRKGHEYMTVVIDYETGRVIWMGAGRKQGTLESFFEELTSEQKESLEAIAMDMWRPYIRAVEQAAPHVKIVFDLYHVVAGFNRVIDKVRNSERQQASAKHQEVFKGSKYLLLKNRKNIRRKKDREHLKQLLEINETICAVRILRDDLAGIWGYRYRTCAGRALDNWCAAARAVGHPEVTKFANTLERHREGILNHCDYAIHTSRLEGINNTIKVIKRKAYGFHDDRYFTLKVKQAFDQKDVT